MAALLNSRNQFLNAAPTRIVGAAVYITTGVANSFTIPENSTTTLPGTLTLTAVPSLYIVPQYTWYRRFGDTGNFTAIANSNNPVLSVIGDQAFITDSQNSGIVQYKVEVIETSTTAQNLSEATVTLPINRLGSNAILGTLTNSSVSISVGEDGAIPAGTVIQSTLIIYNGSADDSANWSASIVASTGISADLINGKTISVNLPINTLNGYVDITATRQGYADVVKRFSISKVVAASSTNILLSKDTHVFNTNFDGAISSYDGASTTIYVYNGPTDVSDQWTITITDHTAGIVFFKTNNTIVLSSVPIAVDSGYITITATRTGFSNLVKSFSFTKVKDAVTYNVVVESSNGDVFKPGQTLTTELKARVFKNDVEVTDDIAASNFRWTRVSYDPQPIPNDDSTWNQTYSSGYKAITISISDVWQRATFHCDILN
jgi:hypothetical protein